jgi:hypothetical protein
LNGVIVVPAAAVFQRGGAAVTFVIKGSAIETRTVKVLRRGRDQIAPPKAARRRTHFVEGTRRRCADAPTFNRKNRAAAARWWRCPSSLDSRRAIGRREPAD